MKYEIVMGIEVHVELATNSKLFCACSAKFGNEANENVCPACAGMPGLLPVANKRAIELGILASLVTNSQIAKKITFDKKNYFYPDLSTGYQITQWFAPICKNGFVEIETSMGKKKITLKQIHIEEDAGKLVHDFRTDTSLIDYNRAGVPLVEIVSNPDFSNAEEVINYLEKLKALFTFAGVSDCRMQEGSMRCDVNISAREAGTSALGVRTEIKNMNSLKAIARAIEYESWRHIDALETGSEKLYQETRRWDDTKGETFSMRNKEDATDYRYFPNPDIMPIFINEEWINKLRESMPEPAHEKYKRLTKQFGLSEYDSKIITSNKRLSDIFDKTTKYSGKPKDTANWIITELLNIAKNESKAEDDIEIDCEKFAKLIDLVNEKTVNRNMGKKILLKIYKEGIDPQSYIRENNLDIVDDTGFLEKIIKEVIAENEKSVLEYKNGNQKVLGFFMGKIMRKTEGKANPETVNELLKKVLG